jgi:hypothetical protein
MDLMDEFYGIYTLPVPAHQRESVEKLSGLVTNSEPVREQDSHNLSRASVT